MDLFQHSIIINLQFHRMIFQYFKTIIAPVLYLKGRPVSILSRLLMCAVTLVPMSTGEQNTRQIFLRVLDTIFLVVNYHLEMKKPCIL